jgi:hypothetical protein
MQKKCKFDSFQNNLSEKKFSFPTVRKSGYKNTFLFEIFAEVFSKILHHKGKRF